jgi:serine kinase of HPr protein (carbohydrate metabolism regulator)
LNPHHHTVLKDRLRILFLVENFLITSLHQNLRSRHMNRLTVEKLYAELHSACSLQIVNGRYSFLTEIDDLRISRLELTFGDHTIDRRLKHVTVLGEAEAQCLEQMTSPDDLSLIESIFDENVSCSIIADGHPVPGVLLDLARRHCVTIMQTPLKAEKLIRVLSNYLSQQLYHAPKSLPKENAFSRRRAFLELDALERD